MNLVLPCYDHTGNKGLIVVTDENKKGISMNSQLKSTVIFVKRGEIWKDIRKR